MFLKVKKWMIIGSVSAFCLLLFIWICNFWIEKSTQNQVFDSLKDLPENKVGLVLGTSKYTKNGYQNPYFNYRITAAAQLFHAGKVKHLIVSGDNQFKSYNEPKQMQAALIGKGIPESAITLDYAGFRTLDSVVRCKVVFGQEEFTIISQKFHNQRALFIANNRAIKGIAYKFREIKFNRFIALDHFFIDLLDENTEVHKHMKAELKEESAPILAFLKKILVNNLIAMKNSPSYGGDKKMPHVSLNIDLIARASIEIEDGKSGAAEPKESSEYDKPTFEEKAEKAVGAMLTAHSLETKQSTYENRSRSPEKIKSMRRFAAQVGDAMEQDARAVEELFNKTKVLNLKAVAKLLGIEDTIKEQKDLYGIINQELGDVIGDIGDVDIDGKRIVIQTPLTAALILSKIKHIENEIPRLKLDSEKKTLKAQLHRAYLDMLLAEFSSSIIKEGELMSKKYDFPFSSIL